MRILLILVSALLLAAGSASALSVTYSLNMTGAQEVPTAGDPDGLGTGTITLDDSTGLISWSFIYSNIVAPTAMHIHGPNGSAGQAAGVLVGLGVATSGGAGTLISSVTTTTTNVASILANPTAFYVNIHNAAYTGGAIRGQLGTPVPEPGTALLVGLGLIGLAQRRRAGRR